MQIFTHYKVRVPVCGGIILNPRMDKVVMVKGYMSKSWGFPKGKINKDERPIDCALREVLEETGFNCGNRINEDNVIQLISRQQSISLYIIPDVPEDTRFETQTRKEISVRKKKEKKTQEENEEGIWVLLFDSEKLN